jgi:hypothetical protein
MRTTYRMIAVLCALCIASVSCRGDHGSSWHDSGVYAPHAVYDKQNDQYLVLYERYRFGDHRNARIYGQRINANTALAGPEFVITGELGDTINACYAVDYNEASRQLLVAWPAADHVNGQLVNADGTLFGPAFTIADTEACPVVAYDADKAVYLVSWADTSLVGVYSQLVGSNGVVSGPLTLVSSDLFLYWYDDGPIAAVYNADSRQYLIVMRDGQSLSLMMLKNDGSVSGNAVILSNTLDYGDRPVALYDSVNKRYLVSWSDHGRLRGQFVNPDGTLQGTAFVMSGALRWMWRHALAFDDVDQRYLEVYDNQSANYYYDEDRVYGQMANADGIFMTAAPGNQFMISPNDFPGAHNPTVVFNRLDRKFLVLWEYEGRDSRYPDIHGQLVKADGTLDSAAFVAVVGGQ